MKVSTAKTEILDKGLAIDHEQFEQLCKMVIERAEPTRELELTPFRGDGGIDIHAVIDRVLFHARFGVETKQYASDNAVGVQTFRGFKRALPEKQRFRSNPRPRMFAQSRSTSIRLNKFGRRKIRVIIDA